MAEFIYIASQMRLVLKIFEIFQNLSMCLEKIHFHPIKKTLIFFGVDKRGYFSLEFLSKSNFAQEF